MIHTSRPHKKKGFSLSEATIVLGVAGLILGGVWLAASNVRDRAAVEDTAHDIAMISQNIRKVYSGRGSFSLASGSDITAMLVNSEVFPPHLFHQNPPTTPRTTWKTTIRGVVDGATTFQIVLDPTIPRNVCQSLVSHFIGTGREPGLLDVQVNGATLGNLDQVGISTLPVACDRITLVFRL